MVKMFLRGLTAALTASLSAATLVASAQSAPPSARPDPLDARASVPLVIYRSSLPIGRVTDSTPTIPWREANDNVARIGGWRSYAREAQASPPPSAAATPASPASTAAGRAPPADQPMPRTPGHSGHKMP